MTNIMPIRDLRKTSEISELAHRLKEPIFITKNGYSDLVVMSTELYDHLINSIKIDRAIMEAEEEYRKKGDTLSVEEAFGKLDEKYYG